MAGMGIQAQPGAKEGVSIHAQARLLSGGPRTRLRVIGRTGANASPALVPRPHSPDPASLALGLTHAACAAMGLVWVGTNDASRTAGRALGDARGGGDTGRGAFRERLPARREVSSQPQLAPRSTATARRTPAAPTPGPATGPPRPWSPAHVGPPDRRLGPHSYFAEGVLAQAKAAYDQGRYRTARALLERKEPSSRGATSGPWPRTQGVGGGGGATGLARGGRPCWATRALRGGARP